MAKTPTKIGKNNSLFYALVVGAFLFWQSLSISYSKEGGWKVETQNVPLPVLTPCLVFIASALGINIKEEIALIAAAVSRNSAAIADLSSKANSETETTEVETTETATENKKDSNHE